MGRASVNLSVRELKAALTERGVDFSKCVEIGELRGLLAATLERERAVPEIPSVSAPEGVTEECFALCCESGRRCWVELIDDAEALCHWEDGSSSVVVVSSLRPLPALQRPVAFSGSFAEARAAAFLDGRLLVVAVTGRAGAACTEKAESIQELALAAEEVIDLLGENAIFWQGSSKELRDIHAQQLAPKDGPVVAMVLPLATDAMRVLSTGPASGSEGVVQAFVEALEALEAHREAANARLFSEEAELRRAQDEEFAAALAADQATAASMAAATENAKGEAQSAEDATALCQRPLGGTDDTKDAVADSGEEQLLKRRHVLADGFLTASALPAGAPSARLMLRLPTGERVERVFGACEPLSRVLAWAECCALLPEAQGRDLQVPASFNLATGFPPRQLGATDATQTLQELGLAPSAALLLLDSDC